MLYAKRLNRVYRVSDAEKDTYLKRGFDIIDENGKLVEAATDKTISYNEHLKEIEELKNALEKANKVPNNAKELKEQLTAVTTENEKLKQENEALKEQIKALTSGENNG